MTHCKSGHWNLQDIQELPQSGALATTHAMRRLHNASQTSVTAIFPNARHACLENRPTARNQASKQPLSGNKKESHQPKSCIQDNKSLLITLSVQLKEENSKAKESAIARRMSDHQTKMNRMVEDACLLMRHQVTSKLNSKPSSQLKKQSTQSKDMNRRQGTRES